MTASKMNKALKWLTYPAEILALIHIMLLLPPVVRLCMTPCMYVFKGAVALKLAQDEHKNNEQDLRKNKRSLKVCC